MELLNKLSKNKFFDKVRSFLLKHNISKNDLIVDILLIVGFLGVLGLLTTIDVFNTISIVIIYLSVFAWFACDFVFLIKQKRWSKKLCFASICLTCIVLYTISSFYKNIEPLNFTRYKKLIMSSSLIMAFAIFYGRRISIKTAGFFSYLSLGSTFITFAIFLIGFRNTENLSLTLSNSNSFAILLTIFFCGCLIGCFLFKRIYLRILCIISTFITLLLIWFTSCRSILFAIIIAAIGYFIIRLSRKNITAYKVTINLVSFFPLMILIIYMLVYYQNGTANVLIFGKPLFTREVIWDYAIHHFNNSPFFGDYAALIGDTGYFQLHNAYIDVLAGFGLFAFVCFFSVLLVFLRNKFLKNSISKISQYCSLCMLATGIFEVSFYNASGIGFLLMIMLLEIASPKAKETHQFNNFLSITI